MESPNLIFKNWLCRCSGLGHILTCLPQPITSEEKSELAALLLELETGVNENGRKTKWTDTKANRVKLLQKKERGEDELPQGAKTHLDNVFRSQFWGRKRLLFNKFLYKGNFSEMDSVGLLRLLKDRPYKKNKEQFKNLFLQGCPDIILDLFDTKSNYDQDTFDTADITSLYEWQLKGYAYLLKIWEGTLAYCLVNSPLEIIEKERKSLYFAMNCPDEDSSEWIEAVRQLEKNHIFDIEAFQKTYPHYTFANDKLDFSIPAILRLKEFKVTLTEKDVEDIERRVMMSRVYLCEKEAAIYEKCPELQIKAIEYYENLKNAS